MCDFTLGSSWMGTYYFTDNDNYSICLPYFPDFPNLTHCTGIFLSDTQLVKHIVEDIIITGTDRRKQAFIVDEILCACLTDLTDRLGMLQSCEPVQPRTEWNESDNHGNIIQTCANSHHNVFASEMTTKFRAISCLRHALLVLCVTLA